MLLKCKAPTIPVRVTSASHYLPDRREKGKKNRHAHFPTMAFMSYLQPQNSLQTPYIRCGKYTIFFYCKAPAVVRAPGCKGAWNHPDLCYCDEGPDSHDTFSLSQNWKHWLFLSSTLLFMDYVYVWKSEIGSHSASRPASAQIPVWYGQLTGLEEWGCLPPSASAPAFTQVPVRYRYRYSYLCERVRLSSTHCFRTDPSLIQTSYLCERIKFSFTVLLHLFQYRSLSDMDK